MSCPCTSRVQAFKEIFQSDLFLFDNLDGHKFLEFQCVHSLQIVYWSLLDARSELTLDTASAVASIAIYSMVHKFVNSRLSSTTI